MTDMCPTGDQAENGAWQLLVAFDEPLGSLTITGQGSSRNDINLLVVLHQPAAEVRLVNVGGQATPS